MIFQRKKRELKYIYFSLNDKVQFYFDIFFLDLIKAYPNLKSTEDDIKVLILNQFECYEFLNGRCQLKRDIEYQSIKEINSKLGHLTNNWNIDWAWIMHHIMLDFQNAGIALNLLNNLNEKEILVYKDIPDKSFKLSDKIYLKDSLTKEPNVFKLTELLRNGHGLKAKLKNIKPVIGATLWNGFSNEYWDLGDLVKFDKNKFWDNKEKYFKYKPSNNRQKRGIKVHIGDELKYDL